MTQQVETLRTAKLESAAHLAEILEPLAQAMAALTDETRQTLESVEAQAQQHAERISRQIESAAKVCQQAALEVQRSAYRLDSTGRNLELSHLLITLATGMMSPLLVCALWLWLAPQPTVMNQLDPKQVAEYLAPVIAAMRPSKGR